MNDFQPREETVLNFLSRAILFRNKNGFYFIFVLAFISLFAIGNSRLGFRNPNSLPKQRQLPIAGLRVAKSPVEGNVASNSILSRDDQRQEMKQQQQ